MLAELESRNAELKIALGKEQASAKRIQDGWRKAAASLKKKNRAATEARRDERAKLKEKAKGLKPAATAAAREEVSGEGRACPHQPATQ